MQDAGESSEPTEEGSRNSGAWLAEIVTPLLPTFHEVVVISLFVNLLAMASPIFVMQVYDRVVTHHGISTLAGLVLGMMILALFDYVLRQTRSRIMQTIALRLDVQVGQRLFNKMMALPLRYLEMRHGSHWHGLFQDAEVIRNTLSGSSALLIADMPFLLLFIALLFIVAEPIVVVMLVSLAIFSVIAWRSGTAVRKSTDEERAAVISRETLVSELIAGRAAIKALALERTLRPIWEERLADTIEAGIYRGARMDGFVNLGNMVTVLTSVTLVAVGAMAIVDLKLTMGSLVAANMLTGRLLGPLNQLVGTWRTYAAFRRSVERLGDLLAEAEETRESAIKLARPSGNISVENATFLYSKRARPALEDINLSIAPGGITAIVGRNGSGKTTLVKLLLGLYHPDEGRVLLDGADLAQFTRAELAQWIGYVPQESVLFSGTIRENIEHGSPGASDERIIAACQAAGVHGFIVDLPNGYASPVGEAGTRMSGGTRQRLALARALVGDPPVLLLDEPSANLDRQGEEDLRRTLHGLAQQRTVIMVTHSPILLSACRTVVVMEQGRVVAVGAAAEILPRLFPMRPPGPTVVASNRPQRPTIVPSQPRTTPSISPVPPRSGPQGASPQEQTSSSASPSTDSPPTIAPVPPTSNIVAAAASSTIVAASSTIAAVAAMHEILT
ncbi:MAG: peptidase domain-containing ABC transporter [Alphaproteobacteria bacterium]